VEDRLEVFANELIKKGKRVCTYVMTHDSGMAPNPFHGVCTLAVCTPNHMRARLGTGDWIMGLTGTRLQQKIGQAASDRRVVYVMRIDGCMDLDTYYQQHPEKRPKKSGSPIQIAGDAFYRKNSNGNLHHTKETEDHIGEEIEAQDIKGNRVFMGKTFWYFGSQCRALSGGKWSETLIENFNHCARSIRYVRGGSGLQWTENDIKQFLSWIPDKPGIYENPIDWNMSSESNKSSCGCGR